MPLIETLTFPSKHVARRVFVYDVTDSTNDRAAALANSPADEGTAVLALSQFAGRGQHGRVWQSAAGHSLLMSIVICPPLALRQPAILTAWAAVGVAETIHRFCRSPARIKWPNDVLIDGKKVSGILIEGRAPGNSLGISTSFSEQPLPAIAGIGLNLLQSRADFAASGLADATSLALAGARAELREVLAALVEELDAEYGRLLGGNVKVLESRWAQRVGLLDRRVSIECTDGGDVRGVLNEMTFAGLKVVDDRGEMKLLAPERVRHVRELAPD